MVWIDRLVLDPNSITVTQNDSLGTVVSFFWDDKDLRCTVIKEEVVFYHFGGGDKGVIPNDEALKLIEESE